MFIQLFNPDTVLVYFTFDITVGRTRYAQTYLRTRSSVAGQTDNAYIMSIIFTSELCTQTNLMRFFKNFLFQFDITESTSVLITRSRKIVVIMSRSKFHRQKILLGRSSANDKCDMIRRTSCRTQCLHLLNQERNQCFRIQDCFRLLI